MKGVGNMNCTTFVGLDVHKNQITVAVAEGRHRGKVESLGSILNTPAAIAKLVRRLGPVEQLYFCYEAGPCGYTIYRQLTEMGARCDVVAPSLIPTKPGERVKTDRRDAKKLARLHRSGELTPVWVPDEAHEALRDLVRAREDAIEDLQRQRNRLTKFLLRLNLHPAAGVKRWSLQYRQWLESLRLKHAAQQVVLQEYLYAIHESETRVERYEKEMEVLAESSLLKPLIDALQALRGIAFISAATLVAEIGDLERFDHPANLMAYAGVVPSEYSSDQNRHQGRITKAGNAHVRRIIIESAWHYRKKPAVSKALKKRQEGLSEEIKAIAWKAQDRLNRKDRKSVV